MRKALPWLAAAFALFASDSALAQGQQPPPKKNKVVLEYDDQEHLARRKTDTNGDGIFDEVIYYKNDVPERAEADTNYDGKVDLWIRYDVQGNEIAQERDTDFDGKVDRWVTLENGKPKIQRDDKNGDGKPESVTYFENGERTRSEEDTNGDGRVDRWITYVNGKPSRVEDDKDGDGKPDIRADFDADGNKTIEIQDTNRDGKFDVTI